MSPLPVHTMTADFETGKALTAGSISVGSDDFPGLKLTLASVVEWRIRSVAITYEPVSPTAVGRVLLFVSPEDWDDLDNVASMVASGAVSTSACARKVTQVTSLATQDWCARDKAAAKIHVVLQATAGTLGFLRVRITYQTRGVTV